ncbi:DNA-directed RNA polymerase subunit omega [Gammaproteobacteria bacterium]|nr:DNA-directed RNA polymerase subunit omega [Gammaproteobacteria bacterium]
MARVTVEDCIEKTEGVFSLIKLASQRARRIANGAQTLLENDENDKPTVLALREIADGHLDDPEFHKTENDIEKELAEELAKSEAEDLERL